MRGKVVREYFERLMIKRREQGVRTEYLVAKRRRECEGYKWVKSAEKGIGKRSDRGKNEKSGSRGDSCKKGGNEE